LKEEFKDIKNKKFAEVFIFNDQEDDAQFNLSNLKKYVKFYVKILQKGTEVEKIILRSDMI
jgi:hypothetical protein